MIEASVEKLKRASTPAETRLGNDFQDFQSEGHRQLVHGDFKVLPARVDSFGLEEDLLNKIRVFGHLRRFQEKVGLVVASRGWYLRILSKSPCPPQ